MEGDYRPRRLNGDQSPRQRTLDGAAPPPAEVPTEAGPLEVLETPPPQHAAARLEERQKRWFRLRESALNTADRAGTPAPEPAENPDTPPKG